jgi:hypothetical protein
MATPVVDSILAKFFYLTVFSLEATLAPFHILKFFPTYMVVNSPRYTRTIFSFDTPQVFFIFFIASKEAKDIL